LLGAALWCGLGVYIHLFEPLPTERTVPWLAFLGLGAVTPVFFPLVSYLAFVKDIPTPTNVPGPFLATMLVACAYFVAVYTGADLSLGGLMPKELWITPWHAVDGRSYGDVPNISFDLMSSYPCYRGDSMFVLSTFFLISNAFDVLILRRAIHQCKAGLSAIARRLCIGVAVMLVNCLSLLYLLVFGVSMSRVLDVFHAIQGLVMAAVFFDLRKVVRTQETKTV